MRSGMSCLTAALTFYYPNFSLSPHNRSRISSAMNTLLLNGEITRSTKQQKSWVGAFVVAKMIHSVYDTALRNEVLSWDVQLSRVQQLLLLSALSCRNGDINKNRLDRHDLPFLCFGDLTMKLIGGNELEDLAVMVKLRNTKGTKGDNSEVVTKLLRSINTPGAITLCPVKIIIILVLRRGAVSATSVHELVANAAGRRDKTVQWTDPRMPVCAAFRRGSSSIISEPAPTLQVNYIVGTVARQYGVMQRVTPHDIRRGSAKDTLAVARQGGPTRGVAVMDTVQAVLSHSHRSLHAGVTRKYTGSEQVDSWEPRVAAMANHDFDQPLLRVEQDDITMTDPDNARHDAVDDREDDETSREFTDLVSGQDKLDDEDLSMVMSLLGVGEQVHSVSHSGFTDPRLLVENAPTTLSGFTDSQLDPGLRLGHGPATSLPADDSPLHPHLPGAEEPSFPRPSGVQELMNMTPVEFVGFLSRINISNSLRLKDLAYTHDPLLSECNGNSHDPVTYYQPQACKYRGLGCKVATARLDILKDHEDTCLSELQQQPGGLDTRVPVYAVKMNYKPGPCFFGCDPAREYKLARDLEAHLKASHPFNGAPCPLAEDCGSSRLLKTLRQMEKHLGVGTYDL
ncbi:hypothetical protein SLS60_008247 [Paraconiothyrium brasiliense]|uniref:C2H2-type domain-containing protein n=1 Tax=Paraconiothyrium brasiliense TaxID=300254 RepID=A0ABR3R019_9PLEO